MVIESPPLGLTIILCSPLYDQHHYIVRVELKGCELVAKTTKKTLNKKNSTN